MLMKTGQLGLSCTHRTMQTMGFKNYTCVQSRCSQVLRLKAGQRISTSRDLADKSPCGPTVQSHFRIGSVNIVRNNIGLAHNFNYKSLSDGVGLSIFCPGAFPKRCFSQVPSVVDKKHIVGFTGLSEIASSFKIYKKNWKRSKALAAHSENSAVSPSIPGIEEVSSVISKEKQAEGGKLDLNQTPKTKSKRRKRVKSKTNMENQSDTSASAGTIQTESSKSVPKAKKPNNFKTADNSKKSINGSELVKVANSSVSRNNKSKKATKNSSSREQSAKEGHALIQSDKACITTGTNEPLQEQAPNMACQTMQKGQKTMKQFYPPTGKSVVVVESVTKATVIQGYLGDMYEVIPSYGHVRDLAARSGAVRPDDDFSMIWEVPDAAWTRLKCIKVALSGAKNLILALDPDREGEAIAWHIIKMMQKQDALRNDITVARVVFHEITETSIKAALQAPRHIDVNLVDAYLARRALDYLIGYNISPILRKKLPGCSSAGSVQYAALSLICDREMEIDEFKPQEYWSVEALFKKKDSDSLGNSFCLPSNLTHFGSKKLNQFSISSHTKATDIEQKINSSNFNVVDCKKSELRKNPPIPFITSTLQQEAANKLHYTGTYTMKMAQKLYEGIQLADGKATGLITYTRTDGLHISNEAVQDIHSLIFKRYGSNFASDSSRQYFKKVKNAQEAHEAIRPTDIRRLPSMLVGIIDEDLLKLYTLIWSRTVACQMEPATIDQIQVNIGCESKVISFQSSCSRVIFLGYQAVYKDEEVGSIQHTENEGNGRDEIFKCLDSLKTGDPLCLGKVEFKQHNTHPPPRYSEEALVKRLDELGIGRPSTYESTIRVLQDRKYLTAKSRVLHPEFLGRMVSAFLANHFSEVTDYSFTADMETELDNVSAGMTEWKGLLKDYWTRFSTNCSNVNNVHIHEVEKMLEKTLGNMLFASLPDKTRTCESCEVGTLIFKVSKLGAGYFIGCDQHPKCKYIAKTLYVKDKDEDDVMADRNTTVVQPKLLGMNPGSNEKILLKAGPYGSYIQLGEDRKGYLPKRASVCQIKNLDSMTLEDALELLRYPLTLGNHPENGKPVTIKLATSGYSIKNGRSTYHMPKKMKPADVTLEKAIKLLKSKDVTQIGRPTNKSRSEIYVVM